MVRKRCRNDEEPDKGNDDGENVKVKTSKKKGKDLVILFFFFNSNIVIDVVKEKLIK